MKVHRQLTFRSNYTRWANKAARKQSGEIDFGCWWGLDKRGQFPRYRVSWISATGELYAVCLAASEVKFAVLAKTEPNDEDGAEALVRGWADTENSVFQNLSKLAERMQSDARRLRKNH